MSLSSNTEMSVFYDKNTNIEHNMLINQSNQQDNDKIDKLTRRMLQC